LFNTCTISIQPFWGHIHHTKLVTDNAANMQKAFWNDPKPVTSNMLTNYFNVGRHCGLRFLFCEWLILAMCWHNC